MTRGRAVALVVLGLVLAAGVAGRPGPDDGGALDPGGTGPEGALGLVLTLEGLGGTVDVVQGPPPAGADTALVLRDRLRAGDVAATLAWVEAGGVLVTTAASPLADGAADGPCPAALAGVDVVPIGDGDTVERTGGDCLGGLVRTEDRGAGTVVALATVAPLTNDLLDEGDAAVLAGALLVPRPGTAVAVLDGPSPGDAPESLADLVARPVWLALAQAGLALVVWVLHRGRRLGTPIVEEQPVAIAGSELVVAVGRLLDATDRPGEAAATLRAATRRTLEARLGLPAGADTAGLAAAVAARTGLDAAVVAAALDGRAVRTDADLVDVAADLDRIRTHLTGSRS